MSLPVEENIVAPAGDFQDFDLLHCEPLGVNLIEASAGTGKTYNIERLFLRLLVEPDASGRFREPGEILTVTFTRAAAGELRERIRLLLRRFLKLLESKGEEEFRKETDLFLREYLTRLRAAKRDASRDIARVRLALRRFDEVPIFTIHSFCNRVLREFSLETGAPLSRELIEDEEEFVELAAYDFFRRKMYDAPESLAGYALERGLSPEYFVKLARRGLNHPGLTLPAHAGENVENLPRNCASSREKLLACWREKRVEIEETLRLALKEGRLNRTSYSENILARMFEEMDFYCARDDSPAILFGARKDFQAGGDDFLRFTSSHLALKTKKKETPPEHEFFHLCERHYENTRNARMFLDGELFRLSREFLDEFRKRLRELKETRRVMSYDDMLSGLSAALRDPTRGPETRRALRASYSAALIDEFQDTDARQWEIFYDIFSTPDHILFLIGDPKQSIYSFRGADLRVYLNAQKHAHGRFTLRANYRSGEKLTRAMNRIFSRPRPFLHADIRYHPAESRADEDSGRLTIDGDRDPPFVIWRLDDEERLSKEEATQTALESLGEEIVRLLKLSREGRALLGTRSLRPGDIAVLTRKNEEAERVQEALRERGVNSVIRTEQNLFETQEALELRALLLAVENPSRLMYARNAVSGDLFGADAKELTRLVEDEEAQSEVIARFREYSKLRKEYGFMRMFNALMHREKVKSRLLTLPGGSRRLTNLLHLAEILNEEEARRGSGADLRLLSRGGKNYEGESKVRLDNDDEAVQIATVHLSKGLEYPVVFCPFTWSASRPREAILPTDETGPERGNSYLPRELAASLVGAPGMESEEERYGRVARVEALAEDLRLFYVALTRARSRLYLFWGRIKDAGAGAPAYMLHAPERDFVQEAENDPLSAWRLLRDQQQRCNNLSFGEMTADLGRLTEGLSDCLVVRQAPRGNARLEALERAGAALTGREFRGNPGASREISSYSSLLRNSRDGDEIPDVVTRGSGKKIGEFLFHESRAGGETLHDIFRMPGGANTGNFFHSVLENVFDGNKRETPQATIARFAGDYGLEDWADVARETLEEVFSLTLGEGEFSFALRDLSPGDILPEMGFYFPLLREKNARREKKSDLPPSLAGSRGKSLERQIPSKFPAGFMKGFMDLVFVHKNRYYLLDWKTNFLGYSLKDYSRARLDAVMEEESYTLQYYIYLAALDEYLKKRLPDYAYEDNIGGVYYLFLRGIRADRGESSGVYFDRPDSQALEWFKARLLQGVGDAA